VYHVRDGEGPLVPPSELRARFPGSNTETWSAADRAFPVRITRSWADRMTAHDDPLGLQVIPRAMELHEQEGDVPDPVGESLKQPLPWVVHKHPDRVLIKVTRRCHLYCRYCFRRDQHDTTEPSADELERAMAYVRSSHAREVILSGGDPLTLSNRKLLDLVKKARQSASRVRIHSRAPITHPARINAALVEGLRSHAPVWMVVHCNHPRELSTDVSHALNRLVDAGIPVLNQTVLLRGVNDHADILVELSEALMQLRVHPYYLHHTDPVPGNGEFRVSINRGLDIHAEMASRLGGIGLPRYVIDPPDGSGKIDVSQWAARMDPTPVP
jgi:lysine 2,3-aminomutase